jgi:hypothetical protein
MQIQVRNRPAGGIRITGGKEKTGRKHHALCGEVGEVGEVGELGSNAAGAQEASSASGGFQVRNRTANKGEAAKNVAAPAQTLPTLPTLPARDLLIAGLKKAGYTDQEAGDMADAAIARQK